MANLNSYIADISTSDYRPTRGDAERESEMRELERVHGINDRNKDAFRREIHERVAAWESRDSLFEYDSEPRLKESIEKRLLISRNDLSKSLTRPRFSRQRANWAQRWKGVTSRLIDSYGYCSICANDLIKYVEHVLKGRQAIKTPRTEGVEWLWDRFPADDSEFGSFDE